MIIYYNYFTYEKIGSVQEKSVNFDKLNYFNK